MENQIYLAIIWIVNGKNIILDGLFPTRQPDMDTCEQRQAAAIEYITNNNIVEKVVGADSFKVLCGTLEQITQQL